MAAWALRRNRARPARCPAVGHPGGAGNEAMASANAANGRVDWVDYAKGFCIILVVMMHSTLGVEAAAGEQGWMHAAVAFAKPFRIPAFFLIAGLFLARTIDRDWTSFFDRKVLHFVYFYALWVTVQVIFKAPGLMQEAGPAGLLAAYLWAFVEPFGTLWFIYLLPIFYVVTRLLRGVNPIAVWLFAAALEIAPIATGSTVIDEFAARFVYFYSGYVFATRVFAFAAAVEARPATALNLVMVWALLNQLLVAQGWAELPVVSLMLGFVGSAALIAVSALIARGDWFAALRFVGQNSIVIYLAFFLPMAASRMALLKSGYISDVGTISLLVTVEAVVGALVIYWLAQKIGMRFLFERPEMFRLAPRRPVALQPAE
jgi:uncharacterized membrane protein YcfT